MVSRLRIDWFLFAIATGLAAFGAAMVYSASAMIAMKESQSQYTYFFKQMAFTLLGLGAMYVLSKIDYRRYQNEKVVYALFAVTVVLLVTVFAFPSINGARRWIRFAGLSLQPSELAKIALPIFLAFFLTKHEKTMGELRSTVIPCIGALILLAGLIFIEPDLGTVIVLVRHILGSLFCSGSKASPRRNGRRRRWSFSASGRSFLRPGECRGSWRFLILSNTLTARLIRSSNRFFAIGSGGVVGEGFAQGQAEAVLFAVSVLGFYLFSRRRRTWADRNARGLDRLRPIAMAWNAGRSDGTGPIRNAARHWHHHRNYCSGVVQYQRRYFDTSGKGNSAAIYFVWRDIGADDACAQSGSY